VLASGGLLQFRGVEGGDIIMGTERGMDSEEIGL
jgi:hypothetical protein